ncbi:MAG TPA: DUF6520 family protein [Cyclobacteriaceae bacterium]|nr:DUF6520 family protein [Cyclobacteriaceae bacterium]
MKKFRMMLPVLAVIFAMVGAVAGGFLPSTQGKYKITDTQCSAALNTDQANCFVSNDDGLPICTITVSSTQHNAFDVSTCSSVLRYIE